MADERWIEFPSALEEQRNETRVGEGDELGGAPAGSK